MAYLGDSVPAEELVFRPVHSIIDQSLHAKLTGVTTNGDGFGIGWYGDRPEPSIYKGTHPAWNDGNLREIAGQIRTRCCSPTSGPPVGHRCSAATATPSGTAAGCGCITGRSPISARCGVIC
jgi:glutamine amidotransferase